MHQSYFGVDRLPGQQSLQSTFENEVTWSDFPHREFKGAIIDGSTVDAGNSGQTNILRAGLLLGRYTAGSDAGKYTAWDPDGANGIDQIVAVLRRSINMFDNTGTGQDRLTGVLVVGGGVLSSALIVPGNSTRGISGDDYEWIVRHQMANRFYLSDGDFDLPINAYRKVVAKTGDYTVLEADNGTMFTTTGATGAVEFTLPATAKLGLHYRFYNTVDQNLTVTAGTADTMVALNDTAADSVALSTAAHKTGSGFDVIGDGSKWLVIPLLADDGVIVTVAT